MYCENCGNYIEPDQKYCPRCGQRNPDYKKVKHSQDTDVFSGEIRSGETKKEKITYLKPKKKVKAGPIVAVVVVLILVAAISSLLYVGYNDELTFDGDMSIKMHEYVVDQSQAEKVVTMTQKSNRYSGGILMRYVDTYAYDTEQNRYYHESYYKRDGADRYVIEIEYYDAKSGKFYYGSAVKNEYDSRYDVATPSSPYSGYDDGESYISRVHSVMEAPGKGCSNTLKGVAFKGNYKMRFTFDQGVTDTVESRDFKIRKILWFDDEYEFKYEFATPEYFVISR